MHDNFHCSHEELQPSSFSPPISIICREFEQINKSLMASCFDWGYVSFLTLASIGISFFISQEGCKNNSSMNLALTGIIYILSSSHWYQLPALSLSSDVCKICEMDSCNQWKLLTNWFFDSTIYCSLLHQLPTPSCLPSQEKSVMMKQISKCGKVAHLNNGGCYYTCIIL